MARNVQLTDLITRAKALTDMDAEAFVGDDQWTVFLNNSMTALYDLLVSKYQDDFLVPAIIAIAKDADGLYSGALPADFYKIGFVDGVLNGSDYQKISRFMTAEMDNSCLTKYQLRGKTKIYVISPPSNLSNVRIFYIPTVPALVAGTDVFDGVNGWDEYVVVDAGIQARIREESDTSALERRLKMLYERIQMNAENRDAGDPMRVVDARAGER